MMRKICVVIINRANYGRLKPLLKEIQNHPNLELQLVVGSSMLIHRFGNGIEIIKKDGFDVDATLYMHIEGESNLTMAKSVSVGLGELTSIFDRLKPDMVLTHADRYETIAAAIAASYMNIPVIHTLGGEITGTIDEHVRHAVTKLSHIHFVAHKYAKERVIQMGERPEMVFNVGNPSLDIIKEMDKELDNETFWEKYGGKKHGGVGTFINLNEPYLMCMQHPVTTEFESARNQTEETLKAVVDLDMPTFWFWPNNDAGSSAISKVLRESREKGLTEKIHFFKSLEVEDYLKLLWHSSCILGNSSSGIMEAGFMGVPCVNIGTRQAGRERCRNVVDVNCSATEIKYAIEKQLKVGRYEPDHLFGDGEAGKKMVEVLANLKNEDVKVQKMFYTGFSSLRGEEQVKATWQSRTQSDEIWEKIQKGVFIIAEAGKNFIKTEEEKTVEEYLENAKELVDEAVKAGADAIKFQTHNVEDEQLNINVTSPHFKGSDRYNWVKRNNLATPVDRFWKPLKKYCDEKGIIFFSTAMSRGAAEILNEVGVDFWKIGSGDILDFVMLDHIRNTGKPIIISSGMSTLEETELAINFIKEKNNRVALLHCVSKYPCPREDLNLKTIQFYKERFNIPIGFSDHSLDHVSSLAAVSLDATVIEKHFSLSREYWGADHKVSFYPDEFKSLVDNIKKVKNTGIVNEKTMYIMQMMGNQEKTLQEGEAVFRPLFRKSLMAGCDIPRGTKITPEMLYAMRPQEFAGGIPSEKYSEVLGKITLKNINKYEPITWDILEKNMEKPIILYTGPEESLRVVEEVLGEKFEVVRTEPSPEELLPKFERCDAFLDASMKVRVPAETIQRADNLKIITTATTGADHIDADALAQKNVPILTLKGQKELLWNITSAAEHSWLLLMACARKFPEAVQHVKQGGWDRVQFPGLMFRGKTIGLIGVGRIGTWMSRYARGFGLSVQAYDPFVDEMPEGVKKVSMDELLETSDFLSIHVNFTPETKGLVTREMIKKIKPGTIFINTSRGDLIDEEAMVEELESGRIRAYGTDVLIGEPDIQSNPVWQYGQNHNNVIITPHIGGFCPESVDITVRFAAERILNHFNENNLI